MGLWPEGGQADTQTGNQIQTKIKYVLSKNTVRINMRSQKDEHELEKKETDFSLAFQTWGKARQREIQGMPETSTYNILITFSIKGGISPLSTDSLSDESYD